MASIGLLGRLLGLLRARPGDPAQRLLCVHHYDETGAGYGSREEGSGLIDRLWSRFMRPREMRSVWKVLGAQPGDEILDVGCGSGTYARLLAGQGHRVVAVDASLRMVEAVRPHVALALRGDIESLALHRTFDRVICFGVLDFVADPACCLENLARHVREDGHLVLLVPRAGLRGSYYRVAKLLAGLRVNSFELGALDRSAASLGLVLEEFAHPLPNSLVIRWRRRGYFSGSTIP